MKKILFLLICLIFIFTSCKKKTDVAPVPVNTISATVDGVNMNFNINVSARLIYVPLGPGSTTLGVQGSTAAQAPGGAIGVTITSAKAASITTGNYTIASSNNSPPVYIEATYDYYDPSSNGPDQPYISDSKGAYPTTVTITSLSSTNVQGTFSGTLVYSQGGNSTKTVTNGKFNVNIN